jgi:hypothetical protein
MPHPLLTVSMVSAALLAAGSARAADMRLEPPAAYTPPPVAYAPPPVAYAPPPVVVVSPPVVVLPPPVAVVPPRVPCWRLGWGYPCVAGPAGWYWRGDRYGFDGRPYWGSHRWHRSYW